VSAGRARIWALALVLLVTMSLPFAALAASGPLPASPIAVASQPTQQEMGVADGPCQSAARSIDNPYENDGDLPVWVFEPTGGAAAPTGGRCDGSRRPGIFISHGAGGSDPASHEALIEHLVSRGNVVVYTGYTGGGVEPGAWVQPYETVDAGNVAAVAATPRVDTSRVGFWGYSMGGGMVPWLAQQGVARGWGTKALWLTDIAGVYSMFIGDGPIPVPKHAQVLVVAFELDELVDTRLPVDVFESLSVPASNKRFVRINSDAYGQPAIVADHFQPIAGEGGSDVIDHLLFRYADVLQACAIFGRSCGTDLSSVGEWSDGELITPAQVMTHPIDFGPVPAVLAECDAGLGPSLNARIERCGRTRV
jgi:hypothetical protein